MFTRPQANSVLETTLEAELIRLHRMKPDSQEYAKTVDAIAKLHKMKQDDKPARLSPDVLATVGANLFGIMLILKYEKFDIITSKALGFVMKAR